MSTSRTIAKNTVFEVITNISEVGISFVVGIALTRGLGTEQYGLYSYTMWLIGLMAIGTNLGLGEMSRRFIPEAIGSENPREAAGFVQLSFLFRNSAAVIICVVILLLSGFLARASGDESNNLIFVIAAFYILPYTFMYTMIQVLKGFQRFDYCFYMHIMMGPLRLVLVIIFVALNYGVVTVLLINILALICSILTGTVLLRKLMPLKSLFSRSLLSSDRRKQALKYSIIIAGMLGLSYLVGYNAEIFFIGLYQTVEDVGFFRLAFTIGPLMAIFPTAFGYVLLPAIAEQFGRGAMEKVKDIYFTSSRYLMLVAIPLAAGGVVLADSLITVIYGSEYSPVILLFQIICFPIAVQGMSGTGSAFIRGINQPGFLLKTRAVVAIINIGLSLLLIPKYGIVGAAIASSVSLVLAMPIYTIYISKNSGATWPMRDMLKITAASLVMGVVVYVVHQYLNDVLSLVIGISLGVIIYITAIFILRVIQEQDIKYLSGLQNSLPPPLRKYYVSVVKLVGKLAVKSQTRER